jgi:glycosyltransferase involved in cell wall biosynthesis
LEDLPTLQLLNNDPRVSSLISISYNHHKIIDKKNFKVNNTNNIVLRLLILNNGWEVRISGGDYHMLRVLKNWSRGNKISLIIPKLGYKYAHNMLFDLYSIRFSSYEEGTIDNYFRLVFVYLIRILRSSFFKFQQSPDVIIASSHLLYDVLPAVILRKRLKSKFVVYVHHVIRPFRTYKQGMWSNISLLNEKISLFLCKKADLIFVVNPDIKDALIAKGFPADKIVITDNGVDHDLLDSVKVTEKRFDGCFCGRIVEKKGVYDLVEIWERVLKYFPESKLVIIGDGPAYSDVLEIVKNKGLNKSIKLIGFVPEKEKISLIKSSKIFVSPSYEEGWGIAVSEAMACGLAIVCYNLSAYKIFGDDIIKVGVGDKEEMAKAIVALLANKNKQESLAANAKEIVNNMLNWDNISAKQLKEINAVVENF